jgi:hypothetical protein
MASIISAGTTSGTALNMAGDTSGVLQLATNGSTTAVTISTAQKVGIGTTSPAQKLDIIVNTADGDGITVKNNNNSAYFTLDANGATGYGVTGWANSTVLESVPASTGGLVLGSYTGNITFQTARTERMRITSSGNVIVGSTSTTGRISSTSDGTFNADINPANLQNAAFVSHGSYGGGVTILDGTQGYVLYAKSSGADFYIRRGTTSSALTGGVALVNAATSWTSASDENVKDIIEPIENAIEKVSTLRTVIGKYKDEEEGIRHPFLIAQDVEKVLPEAISIMNKDSKNECLGLSYTDTIPLLVAAIKEQQTIINDLKARITALEGAA